MRYRVIVGLLAVLPLVSMAEKAPSLGYYVYSSTENPTINPNNFDGPYMGLSFGINPASAKFKFVNNSGVSQTDSVSDLGGIGGLYLGYGWVIDKDFYFGLEGNGRMGFLSKGHAFTVNGNTVIQDVKQSWGTGLSGQVGGVISDNSLLYLNLGTELSHFKYTYFSSNRTTTKMGWLIGLGVNLQLTDSLNLDIRYQFENYPSIYLTDLETTLHVDNNVFSLGLSYHFDAD